MANSRGIRAGRAYVELGVSDKLTAGLKAAQARLQAFGAGVTSLGVKLTAIGGAIGAPLAASVQHFSTAGDELEKMATRTGLSVEALSELQYAADLSGTSIDDLEKGVRKMQQTITDAGKGLGSAEEALSDIGLTFADLAGLSPEKQFARIAEGISRIEDPTLRAAVAQKILGRAGTGLLPLMADGAKGIEAMRQAARDLGLTVSTETAKDAAALNDALGTLGIVAKHIVFVVGSALAPAVTELAGAATRAAAATIQWVKDNKATVVSVAKIAAGTAAAGVALLVLGGTIIAVGAMFGGVASIIGAVGTAIGLLLSPVGLIAAAVTAGGVAFLRYSEVGRRALTWLGDKLKEMKSIALAAMGGIRDAIAAGRLDLAADVAVAAIVLAWRTGMSGLYGAWIETRAKILSSMAEWWTGVLSLWKLGVAAVHKTWLRGAAAIEQRWDRLTDRVAGALLEAQATWDDSIDPEAGKQLLEQQRLYREDQRNRELRSNLDAIDARLEVDLSEVIDAEKNLKDAIEKNVTDDLDRHRQELDAARQRLADAIEQAKNEAALPDGSSRSMADGLSDLLDGINESIGKGLSTRGTFNASAVQSLRGADGADDLAKIRADMLGLVKNVKRLADAATGGKGLVFTGG